MAESAEGSSVRGERDVSAAGDAATSTASVEPAQEPAPHRKKVTAEEMEKLLERYERYSTRQERIRQERIWQASSSRKNIPPEDIKKYLHDLKALEGERDIVPNRSEDHMERHVFDATQQGKKVPLGNIVYSTFTSQAVIVANGFSREEMAQIGVLEGIEPGFFVQHYKRHEFGPEKEFRWEGRFHMDFYFSPRYRHMPVLVGPRRGRSNVPMLEIFSLFWARRPVLARFLENRVLRLSVCKAKTFAYLVLVSPTLEHKTNKTNKTTPELILSEWVNLLELRTLPVLFEQIRPTTTGNFRPPPRIDLLQYVHHILRRPSGLPLISAIAREAIEAAENMDDQDCSPLMDPLPPPMVALADLLVADAWQANVKYLSDQVDRLASSSMDAPGRKAFAKLSQCRQEVLRVRSGMAVSMKRAQPETVAWLKALAKRQLDATGAGEEDMAVDDSVGRITIFPLQDQYDSLLSQTDALIALLNDAYQALIGAITLNDSQESKQQAKRATMLTLLAAIYLPLTLATGIFGMNITEINGGMPRWWAVVIALVILLAPSVVFLWISFRGRDRSRRESGSEDHRLEDPSNDDDDDDEQHDDDEDTSRGFRPGVLMRTIRVRLFEFLTGDRTRSV